MHNFFNFFNFFQIILMVTEAKPKKSEQLWKTFISFWRINNKRSVELFIIYCYLNSILSLVYDSNYVYLYNEFFLPVYTNKKYYSIKFASSTIVVCISTTYIFLNKLNTKNLIELVGVVVIEKRLIILHIIFCI